MRYHRKSLDITLWHRRFAWFPVRVKTCHDGENTVKSIVWLEYVWAKHIPNANCGHWVFKDDIDKPLGVKQTTI